MELSGSYPSVKRTKGLTSSGDRSAPENNPNWVICFLSKQEHNRKYARFMFSPYTPPAIRSDSNCSKNVSTYLSAGEYLRFLCCFSCSLAAGTKLDSRQTVSRALFVVICAQNTRMRYIFHIRPVVGHPNKRESDIRVGVFCSGHTICIRTLMIYTCGPQLPVCPPPFSIFRASSRPGLKRN